MGKSILLDKDLLVEWRVEEGRGDVEPLGKEELQSLVTKRDVEHMVRRKKELEPVARKRKRDDLEPLVRRRREEQEEPDDEIAVITVRAVIGNTVRVVLLTSSFQSLFF